MLRVERYFNPNVEASYIIFKDSSGRVCARNGTTGVIDFCDDDISNVLSAIFSKIGGGRIFIRSGYYTTKNTIVIPSYFTLEGEARPAVVIDGYGNPAIKIPENAEYVKLKNLWIGRFRGQIASGSVGIWIGEGRTHIVSLKDITVSFYNTAVYIENQWGNMLTIRNLTVHNSYEGIRIGNANHVHVENYHFDEVINGQWEGRGIVFGPLPGRPGGQVQLVSFKRSHVFCARRAVEWEANVGGARVDFENFEFEDQAEYVISFLAEQYMSVFLSIKNSWILTGAKNTLQYIVYIDPSITQNIGFMSLRDVTINGPSTLKFTNVPEYWKLLIYYEPDSGRQYVNVGYTRNKGVATITAGTTRVTVNHGLIFAPNKVFLTPLGQPPGKLWVENITSTSFDIVTDTAPTVNLNVSWYAEV